ncbi:unnamed protein product [Menidia menidia]|uniref:(Atlantic silverside) hypothetical protein n=1 Tax=Menidia menidia TaxID=238744 RepID=A0A8S4BD15_9TELE|nr:unnamed protein product [Menidia menidia]
MESCAGLEVCGSGVGQDFPVGVPHRVHTGNRFNLHPRSADVPQHTLLKANTNSRRLTVTSHFFFWPE